MNPNIFTRLPDSKPLFSMPPKANLEFKAGPELKTSFKSTIPPLGIGIPPPIEIVPENNKGMITALIVVGSIVLITGVVIAITKNQKPKK